MHYYLGASDFLIFIAELFSVSLQRTQWLVERFLHVKDVSMSIINFIFLNMHFINAVVMGNL